MGVHCVQLRGARAYYGAQALRLLVRGQHACTRVAKAHAPTQPVWHPHTAWAGHARVLSAVRTFSGAPRVLLPVGNEEWPGVQGGQGQGRVVAAQHACRGGEKGVGKGQPWWPLALQAPP